MRALVTVGLIALPWLAGCVGAADEPTRPDDPTVAVWADDDQGVALGFDWVEDGLVHEIWLADPEGRLERRLTDPRPGGITQLFFMRSAGYVLVHGSTNVSTDPVQFVDVIDLDGRAIRLFEGSISPAWIIPSPDGSRIARVLLEGCDELVAEGRGTCVLDVDLLDPATGEPVREPLHLLFGPEEGVEQAYPDWVFHPSGHLILSDGNLTYEVGPDGDLVEPATAPPTCFRPWTSSSDISSEGRTVYWDRFDERAVITRPEAPGYPDRCFGE